MIPVPRRLLMFVFASGLAVSGPAQSLGEACALVPAGTESVQVCRDPSRLEIPMEEAMERLSMGRGKTPDLSDRLSSALPGLPGLARKPFVVMLTFPAGTAPGQPEAEAFLLPLSNFKAFSRGLKATPVEGLLQGRLGSDTLFLSHSGKFVVLAEQPGTLRRFSGAGANLGRELTPLVPWMLSHDFALILPAATTRQGLDRATQALATLPRKQVGVLQGALAPVLAQIRASVAQCALGIDLAGDGGLCLHARAFLLPGSPLAGDLALPAPECQPMAGLSAEGYLLAFGGSLPPAFSRFFTQYLPELQSRTLGAETAARVEPILALQESLGKALNGQAFRLALPHHLGAPLLSNTQVLLNVDDPAGFLDLLGRVAQAEERSGLLSWGHVASEADVLPGIPSRTTTLTINPRKDSDPFPLKVVLTLLLGYQDRVLITYGQQGPHTLLGVLGSPDDWKLAASAKVAPFPADPAVAAADALLPARAWFRFYLDFKAMAEMANSVIALAPGHGASLLPSLPAAPPLAMAISSDATGVELTAVVTRATQEAIHLLAKPKAPAAPAVRTSPTSPFTPTKSSIPSPT